MAQNFAPGGAAVPRRKSVSSARWARRAGSALARSGAGDGQRRPWLQAESPRPWRNGRAAQNPQVQQKLAANQAAAQAPQPPQQQIGQQARQPLTPQTAMGGMQQPNLGQRFPRAMMGMGAGQPPQF
jgi:hypothetical protein